MSDLADFLLSEALDQVEAGNLAVPTREAALRIIERREKKRQPPPARQRCRSTRTARIIVRVRAQIASCDVVLVKVTLMPLSVTRSQAKRLLRNLDADPLPPKLASPRRVTPDEQLCRAGWMPRFRNGIGHDYWQASGSGESAGVAESYMAARKLALARLREAALRIIDRRS